MRCKVVALSLALVATAPLSSCAVWFFSGEHWIDRSRPVVLLETTGGVEFGAATEFGVLALGSTAADGPCRVHYFLGPTPIVETGELTRATPTFVHAEIDLKTQLARALDHSPDEDDELWAMWTPDGRTVETVSVELARGEGLGGDLLRDPGVELPGGATVLCRGPKGEALFAGLIAGTATVAAGPTIDRVRELLAVPRAYPIDLAPKYRSDGISVMKPVPEKPAAAPAPAPADPPVGEQPAAGGTATGTGSGGGN